MPSPPLITSMCSWAECKSRFSNLKACRTRAILAQLCNPKPYARFSAQGVPIPMSTEKLTLQLHPRAVAGKAVKKLRREGLIPVAVCGKGVEAYSAQVQERELMPILRRAGSTTLVELSLGGQLQQAFIQEVQHHSVTRKVLHADFHVVDLKVEINV